MYHIAFQNPYCEIHIFHSSFWLSVSVTETHTIHNYLIRILFHCAFSLALFSPCCCFQWNFGVCDDMAESEDLTFIAFTIYICCLHNIVHLFAPCFMLHIQCLIIIIIRNENQLFDTVCFACTLYLANHF